MGIFIHAFITNKIDYCNSLLHSMLDIVINSLQKLLNIVAQISTKKNVILIMLHWLHGVALFIYVN